ncbi:hypothetical protein GGQ84_000725 [Desulfitispora alkaliphila]|uniref:hypothetical protein n=1 Tax=Desulfitispora alkaliphila TaxID=622674 RepID=UPI003D21EB8C
MIGDGGPFSPEVVSDRIVDFAKAMLGGTLPEISYQTYDLVMEKLDAWKSETK